MIMARRIGGHHIDGGNQHTSDRPLIVFAEHSKYLRALILAASFLPVDFEMNSLFMELLPPPVSFPDCCCCCCWDVLNWLEPLAGRKSIFVPTRTNGAFGQWCFTSGAHFELMLWKEWMLSTLKHRRKTSAWKLQKKVLQSVRRDRSW